MIKDELISIKISNKTLSYYSKFFNDINIGDVINISSIDLQKGSHIKIKGICDYCGNEREISKKAYNTQTNNGVEKFSCSKKCSLLKSKETNIKKYNVENPFQSGLIKERIKRTNLEKWGVENPQQSDIIKQKTELTNLEKWGYKRPSMSNVIKDKVKKTNNDKFGFDYPAQSKEIREKMIYSCYDKYGVDNFSKTLEFKKMLQKKSFNKMVKRLSDHGELLSSGNNEYKIKCGDCNKTFSILYTLMYNRIMCGDIICTYCNPKNKLIKENELLDFIKENYRGDVVSNSRRIISKELDIYLPEIKLALEFNGLYWHSDLYKNKNYHLDKTKECLYNNIQLLHIWEDDWCYKKDIVKSIILNKLGKSKSIYARNTEIKEITDNNLIRYFLNKNHLQGFIGSSIKLGLFYNGELVSLMTFGKLRKSLGNNSKKGTYELLRFCNKLNINVVGGASKLLRYFIKNYEVSEIISYSDNSRSNGNLYEKLGFTFFHDTVPNYYWVIDGIRKHRFNYRKDKLVSEGYNINETEIEIMNNLGYYRIFDCGSKKWIFNLNKS
jgi:hypothetical protein